ncbi:MAG: hypothetical protein IIC27_01765 [Chloroflexi bacterium]|nr:hypothetical protein [Chloroflexota bacterium]
MGTAPPNGGAVLSVSQRGIQPFAPAHSDAYKVRSAAVVLARDIPFHEGAQEELKSMP